MRPHTFFWAMLGGLCGALALGCRSTVPTRASRPNVILITIDTLRADAVGVYSKGGRSLTPNIDRLAQEGVTFLNATCPMPQTRPSHFSMLTSRYPRDHGVVNNVIPLGRDALTLTEVFQQAGWRTGGFVAVKLLDRSSGADQGFDAFEAPAGPALPADQVVPRAVAWLAGGQGAAPSFLWLHLFDPHMPYAPPAGYRPLPPAGLVTAPSEISWPGLLEWADRSGGDLPDPLLRHARRLYEGEVAFADHALGELLDHLRSRDLLDSSVVLLTSDHGECFDHGIYFEHSDCLYEGAVRVPLVLRLPGARDAGRVSPEAVENLDVAPTLLQLAGVQVPSQFRGHSLFGPYSGTGFLERPLYQSEAAQNRPRRQTHIRAVGGDRLRPVAPDLEIVGSRTARWKFLVYGRQEELYDLRQDPQEMVNLASTRPDVRGDARGRLESWLRAYPLHVGDHGAINPELRQTLRALGYLQ